MNRRISKTMTMALEVLKDLGGEYSEIDYKQWKDDCIKRGLYSHTDIFDHAVDKLEIVGLIRYDLQKSKVIIERLPITINEGQLIDQPLSTESTCFHSNPKSKPKDDFIFNIMPRRVVGSLTGESGIGKSFFLLSLAMAGAGGGNFGPITAPKPVKTLVISAEDPQDVIDLRLWDICQGQFPPLLHAASIYGERLLPLMRLEGANPILADAYYWLEETIINHPDLELLILDPKSRFYGLDENNSAHALLWLQALEGLSKRHNLTIVYSQNRPGIGAACRWRGVLTKLNGEQASQDFGIDEPGQYIAFELGDMDPVVFKRGNNGVLEHYALS